MRWAFTGSESQPAGINALLALPEAGTGFQLWSSSFISKERRHC
jgi:hypothetical protein